MSAELLFATYKCTNCQETISGVRVQCHEPSCQDVMLVLCLQCFASGAELGPHKNSHPYSFNDPNAITIFRGKGAFSALEELKLLKAVEHYGFGNWDDISKDIETRSPEEAKEEYISKFLNGTIGKHTWKLEHEQKLSLTDHTTIDDRSIDELQVEKFSESNMEICTTEHAAQLGYMPYRDDFEREYDVTAEQLVSNLALTSEDDEIESALKLAVVDIYNRRLRERARKKRIARDYRLIQEFFRKFENGKGKGINQTKDERGLRLSLKNFRQFYSNDAFERLIHSLERERILRIRLTELCRYRWNGLTKIDECEHFEKHAAANHHRTSCPFGFGHYKQLACLSGANGCYVRHISSGAPKRSHFASSRRQNGSSNHINEISAASIGTNGTVKKRIFPFDFQNLQHNTNNFLDAEKETNSNFTGQKFTPRTDYPKSCAGSSNNKSSLDSTNTIDPMQVAAPLLSFNEHQLCSSLNLPPTRYITIKTVLLSNSKINDMDPVEKRIKKHLIQAGWLRKTKE